MFPLDIYEKRLKEHHCLVQKMQEDKPLMEAWQQTCAQIINTYKNGNGKVFLCGNGGSAADAQHIAAELSGRFYKDRAPLFAEALHVNTSFMTAVANDYSYDQVYERAVDAFMSAGDLLIAISTSGNSANVVKAAEKAKSKSCKVIALTGKKGGQLKDIAHISIQIPSEDTARIQEAHIMIGHTICEAVEKELFA